MQCRPRRSILYLPAIRDAAVARAMLVDADCIILDLEDSVAPEEKCAARDKAILALGAGSWGHREVLIRVNGLATEWCAGDFAAASAAHAHGIVVPKINSASEAEAAVKLAAGVPVWAMIETPQAIIEAAEIAKTAGVTALLAGFADLAKDLRVVPDKARSQLQYSMGAIIVAARAARIQAFDGIYANIKDEAGMRAETQQALSFGFDGKSLIHPLQVVTANEVFTPSASQIDEAIGLIEAYDRARGRGSGVTTHNGKLVEILHVEIARALIKNAATISSRHLNRH